jgi:hypothetical protein
MPPEVQLLISVANAIFPVYYNILSIVAGRLHWLKFPTHWTGNCSMASDFLRLICKRQRGTCPLPSSLCWAYPRAPCKRPVDTSFQAPVWWPPAPPAAVLSCSPGNRSLSVPMLCHFFLHTVFIVFRAGSVRMCFISPTMGSRRATLVKSHRPGASGPSRASQLEKKTQDTTTPLHSWATELFINKKFYHQCTIQDPAWRLPRTLRIHSDGPEEVKLSLSLSLSLFLSVPLSQCLCYYFEFC